MPTDLLSQIEAAAANSRPAYLLVDHLDGWHIEFDANEAADIETGSVWTERTRCTVSRGALPLSAIAEELRAKDAEIERLRKEMEICAKAASEHHGDMPCRVDEMSRREYGIFKVLAGYCGNAEFIRNTIAAALAAKESAND